MAKFKYFKALAKEKHADVIADYNKATGHDKKCDHFVVFESGKTDYHCTGKRKRP